MIFAAGLGTRLKPLTDECPKALVKVNGKPLLQWNIEALIQAGAEHIVINVHHHPDMMMEYIGQLTYPNVKLTISDETDELLDTGGGLKKASALFIGNKPIIIQNVDILSGINYNKMLQYHNHYKPLATLATKQRESSRYLLFDDHDILFGWENVKTQQTIIANSNHSSNLKQLAFSGIQIISPELLSCFPNQKVFPIIDLYLHLAKNMIIKGFDHTADYWFDIGSSDKLKLAETYLKSKI